MLRSSILPPSVMHMNMPRTLWPFLRRLDGKWKKWTPRKKLQHTPPDSRSLATIADSCTAEALRDALRIYGIEAKTVSDSLE